MLFIVKSLCKLLVVFSLLFCACLVFFLLFDIYFVVIFWVFFFHQVHVSKIKYYGEIPLFSRLKVSGFVDSASCVSSNVLFLFFEFCLNSNSSKTLCQNMNSRFLVDYKQLLSLFIPFLSPPSAQETTKKSLREKRLYFCVKYIFIYKKYKKKKQNVAPQQKTKINSWKKNRTKGSRLKVVCVLVVLAFCLILFFCSVGN